MIAGAGAAAILTSGGSPVGGYTDNIKNNIKVSAALAYRPTSTTDYFLELANYTTQYTGATTYTNNATTFEVGAVYNF